MHRSVSLATAALLLLSHKASSQLLTTPNSPLPSCATTCPALQQAQAACGGDTTSSQQIWICFCQSAYLSSYYSSTTGDGVCDGTCGSESERQSVRGWYIGECGSDLGASEHVAAGGAVTAVTSTSATGIVTAAATGAQETSGGSVTSGFSQGDQVASGSWWSMHWKWILMLIILVIAFTLITILAVWLKRRHDRRRDLNPEPFNPGITSRSVPAMTQNPNATSVSILNGQSGFAAGSSTAVGGVSSGSRRQSPARTREAFMPYGYAYSRSETRIGSQPDGIDTISASPNQNGIVGEKRTGSPLAREESAVQGGGHSKGKKRVLVRERDDL